MTIAEFIQAHMESLLEDWEEYAATLLPAAEGMDTETLRDFAKGMLEAIVEDMQTPQTRGEQRNKARGNRPGSGQQLSDLTDHAAVSFTAEACDVSMPAAALASRDIRKKASRAGLTSRRGRMPLAHQLHGVRTVETREKRYGVDT